MVDGQLVNCALVDGGATINLVLKSMLGKLGKRLKDLVQTNIDVTNCNGKTFAIKGMVLLNIRVGSIDRSNMFVVVLSKASYNLLL